ncbi:phosphoenolpyruvate hydrolase family protein [Ectothiorhodospiraceae bacterium WFHF3C12]|nr:phosphoenolpyruvate hydrolase family protein [Ectothiorhodospiraceae bacterium WFHF3C12]
MDDQTDAGDNFLVGAAIGTGLVARAVERGQADFVLALNVGRLRSMGLPSISAMLPFAPANDLVMSFVEYELVRPTSIPVYVGLGVWEPQEVLQRRLRQVAAGGLAGVVNFPTSVHYPPEVARALEVSGVGFSAELDMLSRAQALGCRTLVYVKTRDQARRAAALKPYMVCVNFGWNAGGRLTDLQPEVSIDEAILRARDLAREVRRQSPRTLCVIEGGPVVHPGQVAQICVEAGMQGYIGGSTLDRLPIENAVVDATLAFKSAGSARQQERAELGVLLGRAAEVGIRGRSSALTDSLFRLQALAENQAPLLVSGAPGTQRHAAVEFARRCVSGTAGELATLVVNDHPEPQLGMRLFGHGDGRQSLLVQRDGQPLVIDSLDGLSRRWQRKLARLLVRGMVTPFRGSRAVRTRPWLIFLADRPLEVLQQEGLVIDELCELLQPSEVVMPRLAERVEDIGEIIQDLCARLQLNMRFDDSAVTVLQRHAWPDDMRGLRNLLERLRANGCAGRIGAADVEPCLGPAGLRGESRSAQNLDEATREWLVAALRRNRFNRTATAQALGISRKTLYNRLRRLGL